jgi:hypothetical protein
MVEMKIIIDSPDGIYAVLGESVQEVENELRTVVNQFIDMEEPPYYFEFRNDIQYMSYDFIETDENGKNHFNTNIKVLELDNWFDYFRSRVEKAKKEFLENETEIQLYNE